MFSVLCTKTLARIASQLVAAYPLTRGRYRLRQYAAARFLLAQTDTGDWIRVSGASGFEWKVFDRRINEPITVALLKNLLGPGMTFFDVGANIGYYSLLAARYVGETGNVHAFEPTPAVAVRLSENIWMNNLSTIIHCNAVAIGSSIGTTELFLNGDDSEANSLFCSDSFANAVTVNMVTLDDYIAKYAIPHVDVLKVDVEGAEIEVLNGATNLLKRPDAPLLIIEFNPIALRATACNSAALRSTIESMGYNCVTLEVLTVGDEPVSNVLATKPYHEARFHALSNAGSRHVHAKR